RGLIAPHTMLSQQKPGQRDVLKLPQVRQVVIRGQVALARPRQGLAQSSLGNQHPCPECPDRSYVRMEVTYIQALGLFEQNERAVQVTLNYQDPSHRDAASIAMLRKPDRLAQIHAARHVLAGG